MRLRDRLPNYANSRESKAIQDAFQVPLDRLWEAVFSSQDQVFVRKATWGLELWETMLGIPVNVALSDEVRRSRIISKLRGAGTSTVSVIESIVESYYNGDAQITENYSEYTFTVTFLSTRGRPPGLEELKAAVNAAIPAHLGVIYVFIYVTHEDIKKTLYTHEALAAYRQEDLRNLEV